METQKRNDRASWLQGPSVACSTPPSVESPWRLVLLGPPGVGKGTQAQLLSDRLGACHLSTGDVFRAAGNRALSEHTPAMNTALHAMRRGELVSDITVWDIVHERSGCLHCGGGFILDGFPRTVGQAEALTQLMVEENISLDAVVAYELPLEEIVTRLSGRRTCRLCKAVYHLTWQPPKTEGLCDRCCGDLFQREDDGPDSITVRMQGYQLSSEPVIEFYRSLGCLMPISAAGSVEEIYVRTLQALKDGRCKTHTQHRDVAFA